ncbi:LAFE_0H09362g1_1 [Lachancea fermentati]|uniref:Genetic interactor of prohibitin 5, mitochondrial n=1 Tax=Lachancea fermentati TaxID=4955 RepID=A0A1G4MKG5_LACFM|nr:LAFE_0H09362g1_1 [Lachancea fermentati]
MKDLLNAIRELPLDSRTVNLLQGITGSLSVNSLFQLRSLVRHFQLHEDSKSLDAIIYNTYFHWSNYQLPHLKSFRVHYSELRDHWPYERHRMLFTMASPKKTSLRYMWNDCKPKVLAAMQYNQHRWPTSKIPYCLPEIQRTLLFNEIFQHYLFLKKHPHLCKNKRQLPVPIVEIPMKPLGQDIADVRIANLFKRKVAETWTFLAEDNPALSLENEELLLNILNSPNSAGVKSSRWLRRMYQRACRRAYVVRPHPVIGLAIEPSKLVKIL